MDFIAGMFGRYMAVFDWFGPLKEVFALVVGGSIGTAAGVAAVFLLDLPYVRAAWGGVLWTAGKAGSLLFVRWFGRYGQRIEDKLQQFVDFSRDRFFAGLDQDDK